MAEETIYYKGVGERNTPMEVIQKVRKVYCKICGRQIVDYYADNERYVGPSSEGCLMLVQGYACPPCTREEQKLEELGYSS